MRTTPFGYALCASAIVALLSGCNGGASGSSSAFSPVTETGGAQNLAAARPLDNPITCPIVQNDVPLASAASFAVLGGTTVTSTGLTRISGNLGVSPGTSITGFGPGVVSNGAIYAAGPVPTQAQADLTAAYNNVVGRQNPTALPLDIGGTTITPGLYNAPVSLGITGTVTLDGQNHKDSLFVFQIPTTLTTEVDSKVHLINEANACNVFWQVGSSATLNVGSQFNGTIMAASSISVSSGVDMRGRLLAEGGAVTMIDDNVYSYWIKH